jgi:hypothetical protein
MTEMGGLLLLAITLISKQGEEKSKEQTVTVTKADLSSRAGGRGERHGECTKSLFACGQPQFGPRPSAIAAGTEPGTNG